LIMRPDYSTYHYARGTIRSGTCYETCTVLPTAATRILEAEGSTVELRDVC